MSSLEKKMFFLPSRLIVKKDRLLISFSLSVIPLDMSVTFMALHIPLYAFSAPAKAYIREITEKWSEESVKKGILPSRSGLLKSEKCSAGQEKLIIDVTNFREKWRLKKKYNHGIYVRLKNKKIKYLEDNPPYLVVDTI